MPLYEYQCEACGKITERIQKFSDPPLESCPACGGRMKKLLSSPAIQFKGSGWYITDYARKGGTAEKSPGTGSSEQAGEKADKADKPEKSKTGSDPGAAASAKTDA